MANLSIYTVSLKHNIYKLQQSFFSQPVIWLALSLSHTQMHTHARTHTHTKLERLFGCITALRIQGSILFEHELYFKKIAHDKLPIFRASPNTMHAIFQRLDLH